jgi:hypothetical protein
MRCSAGRRRRRRPEAPTAKYLALSRSFSSEGISMQIAIRRIHSKYLDDKVFPKDITEFEIHELGSAHETLGLPD